MQLISRLRNRLSTTTVLALAASLLLGSALLAVVVDRVSSTGNNIESSKFSGLEAIQIAVTAPENITCANVTWTNGPSAAVVVQSVNLETEEIQGAQRGLCIRARRHVPARVQLQVDQIVDSEVACSGPPLEESAADGTCSSGGVGELSPLLRAAITARGSTSPTASFCDGAGERSLRDFSLGTGGPVAICELRNADEPVFVLFVLKMNRDATELQRQTAQTDMVRFDITLGLDSR